MKLFLIRHGACRENLERRFLGITDSPLDPVGEEQAQILAKCIPSVEHLYLSPLIRCSQTASIIWPNTPQTVIDELRETDFGPFERKTHDELIGNELYNLWICKPEDPTIVPQVEDIASCGVRASNALNKIALDARAGGYDSVGVVSHGGTLMGMLTRHGRPRRDYYSWYMGNCGGYVAELTAQDEELILNVIGSV